MPMVNLETLDLNTLVALCEKCAENDAGGHMTIIRSSDGWQCAMGGEPLTGAFRSKPVKTYPSLQAALASLLLREDCL